MKTGRILLNIMYTGKYVSEYKKIGHEIINLFKADDDNNYIYVTPYGTVKGKVDILLMARSISGGRVEILGKADGLEYIDDNKGEKIEYCGYPLKKILSDADSAEDEIFITFKCADVRKPAERIILSSNENEDYFIDGVKRLANQSMKYYFEESDAGYQKLQSIINNQDLWEKCNSTTKVNFENINLKESRNFLSIIGKKDDELVFSNWLAFYFSEYNKICKSFVNEVLGLNVNDGTKIFLVEREKKHIDILLTNNEYVIVIENKIRSGINGVNGEASQLSQNYYQAQKIANGREIKCFIFSPNYNKIDLKGLECGNEYKIINYQEIYEFFAKHGEYAMYDKYYGEFLSALKPHTKEIYNDWEEILKIKFIGKIKNCKQ